VDLSNFENNSLAPRLAARIESLSRRLEDRRINLMEVCGTHTMAIARYRIRQLLPESIRLARMPGVVFCTFGDMIRVPGTDGSLSQARAQGADVRVVYSCLDALELAEGLADRQVIFAGVGFETTSPTVAATILEAKRRGIRNFSVYPAFKLVPPALRAILSSDRVDIDGFLLPGHVSSIIGSRPYEFISRDYKKPGVIAGFEALDILGAIIMLLEMLIEKSPEIKNEYRRGVSPAGNQEAMKILYRVFRPAESRWRAIGRIADSGLDFHEDYKEFDARLRFHVTASSKDEPQGCLCGQVMMGAVQPDECPLFGGACRPESPVGPCMVSSEGACAAWFKYGVARAGG